MRNSSRDQLTSLGRLNVAAMLQPCTASHGICRCGVVPKLGVLQLHAAPVVIRRCRTSVHNSTKSANLLKERVPTAQCARPGLQWRLHASASHRSTAQDVSGALRVNYCSVTSASYMRHCTNYTDYSQLHSLQRRTVSATKISVASCANRSHRELLSHALECRQRIEVSKLVCSSPPEIA